MKQNESSSADDEGEPPQNRERGSQNCRMQHIVAVAEPGKFNVQIGLDSQDVTQQSFELL